MAKMGDSKILKRHLFFLLCTCFIPICMCTKNNPTGTENPDKRPDPPPICLIAFSSNRNMEYRYQLYTMNSDGSDQKRLTQDSASYLHPRFSPDGSKIVCYSHSYDDDDEIYIIDSDGSNLTNLSNSPGNDGFPQFSPDGRKIVFTSDRDGNREVYIMDTDGGNQFRLTNNSIFDHAPQFSPDGSTILYYSVDENYSYNIYTVETDGRNRRTLTFGRSYKHLVVQIENSIEATYFYGPQYSPDGSKIVFTSRSDIDQNIDIYIMDNDGENHRRLTDEPGYNFSPRFFPDGSKIIFMTHRWGNFDVFTMNPDGSDQVPLYNSATGHAIFSSFSPDGSLILLSDNDITEDRFDIFIMNSDGSSVPRRLTENSQRNYFPQFQQQP